MGRPHGALAVMVLAVCGAVRAQEAPAEPPAPKFITSEQYLLQIEASAWYVSPGGDVKFPGAPAGVRDTEMAGLNLDTPRLSALGEVHLRMGNGRLTLGGMGYSLDRTTAVENGKNIGAIALAAGEEFRAKLDFASFEAHGAYRVAAWPGEVAAAPGARQTIAAGLDVLAGFRVIDLAMDVQPLDGRAGYEISDVYAAPIVGVKGSMDFWEDFTIDVQVSIGGFAAGDQSVFTADILVGGQWRPTENLGVQIGYRTLDFVLENDSARAPDGSSGSFEWSGSMAGLYAGVTIRF